MPSKEQLMWAQDALIAAENNGIPKRMDHQWLLYQIKPVDAVKLLAKDIRRSILRDYYSKVKEEK